MNYFLKFCGFYLEFKWNYTIFAPNKQKPDIFYEQ